MTINIFKKVILPYVILNISENFKYLHSPQLFVYDSQQHENHNTYTNNQFHINFNFRCL